MNSIQNGSLIATQTGKVQVYFLRSRKAEFHIFKLRSVRTQEVELRRIPLETTEDIVKENLNEKSYAFMITT